MAEAVGESEAAWDAVIVGAGAAGLLAAARAAECGRRTLLLEKNDQSGVKILMSGGTRCNVTHATDERGIVDAFGRQGRFLHSALAALGPADVVQLLADEGVPTKVEATGKVFPLSNQARDVRDALERIARRNGAQIAFGEPLLSFQPADGGGFKLATPRRSLVARRLLITSGGMSYPASGTTGEGYGWAKQVGHRIEPPRPALTPITTSAPWVPPLRGVSVIDAAVKAAAASANRRVQRSLPQARGGLLFAHFGLSGPAVLDVSRIVTAPDRPDDLHLVLDLLPNTSVDEVDMQFRPVQGRGGQRVATLAPPELPRRLFEALVAEAGVDRDLRLAELPSDARRRLTQHIKALTVPVAGVLGFRRAEVTAGGVPLDEVDSRDLQSKLVPGLFFAGEVLDLDGPIGGYNFQAAFSTGWLAGSSL